MSTALLNGHRNGHRLRTMPLPTTSVRDFFEQIPWTGAAPTPLVSASSTETSETAALELNMKLKVGDFFEHFPWDGKPDIAAPVAPLTVQPELPADDDLTLDGFADLF
ncbi:MAG: hypothetical protein ACFBSG_10255 [Leptolyngbyaceae cyanobacterium]